uniref:GDP-fucose protein O-fucosyltransferase 2 n=1 Tax=Phallusia mammillata TaxID=59560 RepID=A0A6F9DK53_9ASCI|nr:uncharacterized protein LOC108950060 [Phallusia mammillata]
MHDIQQKVKQDNRTLHCISNGFVCLKLILALALVWSIGMIVSHRKEMRTRKHWKTITPAKNSYIKAPKQFRGLNQSYGSLYPTSKQNDTLLKVFANRTFDDGTKTGLSKKTMMEKQRPETVPIENLRDFLSSEQQDCLLWDKQPNLWDIDLEPQIKLDSTKFLYPGLIWGPNNQIVGLWQSIYLALRLNRTLVVPYFHAHYTIGGGTIRPSQRIDVERLRHFVSAISLESFRHICNSSFDVVLQAQTTHSSTLKDFEKDTKMNILHIDEARVSNEKGSSQLRITDKEQIPSINIPAYPPNTYQLTYEPWLTSEREVLRKAYNTSAKCGLYSAPFNTIAINAPKGIARALSSSQLISFNATDREIYSAVVDSVRRPPAVVKTVERYKAAVFRNEPYVAVHWRYDFKDWGGARCRPDHPNKYSKMCEELRKITPEDVANGIFTSLNKAKVNQSAWKHVYIASPPILRNFANKVVEVLQKLNSYVENPGIPLDTFLMERYQPCWKRGEWSNEQEIFLLAEMEVLAQSEWFFFAPGSTFSSNVQPLRWEKKPNKDYQKKFEKSVYEIAKNAMMKRTGLR